MHALGGILEWVGLFLGAAAAGGVLGLLIVRLRLVRRVQKELGRDKVLLVTSSRMCFSDRRRKASEVFDRGILMLLKNGLYYHSWLARRELFIPGPSITYIGLGDAADGRVHEGGGVNVRFLNTLGKEDGVMIRLLAPEQWVSAIKTHLIARAV